MSRAAHTNGRNKPEHLLALKNIHIYDLCAIQHRQIHRLTGHQTKAFKCGAANAAERCLKANASSQSCQPGARHVCAGGIAKQIAFGFKVA